MAAVASLDDKNKVDLPDFAFLDSQKKAEATSVKQLKKWTHLVWIAHDPAAPKDWLMPRPDQPLTFTVAGQTEPYLKPFWQVDTEGYTCYPVIEGR